MKSFSASPALRHGYSYVMGNFVTQSIILVRSVIEP